MKKYFLGVVASLSVPLLLFVNVLQSQKYMINYFEVKGLISKQELIVQENKKLINRVAELESPKRVVDLLDSEGLIEKIGGGEIIRIEVVDVEK